MRQRAWTAFRSVIVHPTWKLRKLCLKDFICGNHNSWLPFSCVCVNSLINIAGKDCVLCYSVSLLEEAPPRFSAFQGQFPHFLCFKKFCMRHTQGPGPSTGRQKGDLSPLVSRVVIGGNCGDLHLLESHNIGTRSTFYALQIGKLSPSPPLPLSIPFEYFQIWEDSVVDKQVSAGSGCQWSYPFLLCDQGKLLNPSVSLWNGVNGTTTGKMKQLLWCM